MKPVSLVALLIVLLVSSTVSAQAECTNWRCSPSPSDGLICQQMWGPLAHQFPEAVDCDTYCECAPDPGNGDIRCHCQCNYQYCYNA